jgi:hypothetical protein
MIAKVASYQTNSKSLEPYAKKERKKERKKEIGKQIPEKSDTSFISKIYFNKKKLYFIIFHSHAIFWFIKFFVI